MSKAVLVMEMPTKCRKCSCRYIDQHGDAMCKAKRKFIDTGDGSKPNWCPLRELPGKAYHEYFCDNGRYDRGWNECLDKITGEREG